MVVSFDPNDKRISPKVRERIESWDVEPVKDQHKQYGPLNKYFNEKFLECLVKPQGIIRVTRPQAPPAAGAPEDQRRRSTDSYGESYDPNDDRRYPDFIIASYYRKDAAGVTPHDKIRVIVEVGSLGQNKPKGGGQEVEEKKVGTQEEKKHVAKQLHDYCTLIGGEEDARFHEGAIGVGILGTEVCFVSVRRAGGIVHWTNPSKWYSLYGDEFPSRMDKMADIVAQDPDAET